MGELFEGSPILFDKSIGLFITWSELRLCEAV